MANKTNGRQARTLMTNRRLQKARVACTLLICMSRLAIAAHGQTITQLFSFPCSTQGVGACPDGSAPNQRIQASDGNFYGVTQYSSLNIAGSGGTVYRVTPSGHFTLLFTFKPASNGNTVNPGTALVEANDGFLHGTSYEGGATNNGTLFRISKAGTGFQVVHSFCSAANCADGGIPDSLILGHDGNLYGATRVGGDPSCSCGTIFRIAVPGTLTTLRVFQSSTGGIPHGVQGTDGTFFAIAAQGVSSVSQDFQKINTLATFAPVGFDGCGGNGLVQAANGSLIWRLFLAIRLSSFSSMK
jgi:uncharacterized repeat protein (TIGR03803 family)